MKLWRALCFVGNKISDAHNEYVSTVLRHPIVLLFVAIWYLFLMFAISLGGTLLVVNAFGLWVTGNGEQIYVEITLICFFIAFSLIFASHYFYIVVLSFLSTASLDGSPGSVLRVVQLVATTSIYFSVVHYYIALFYGQNTYPGLVEIAPKGGWPFYKIWLDKLIFVPSGEMIVDCVYFSTVTMATIGYGDIHPGIMISKIATMVDIYLVRPHRCRSRPCNRPSCWNHT